MKNIFKNGLISRFVMMILFVFGLNTIVSSPALAAVTVKYLDDTGVQCATGSSTNCSAVTSCNGKIVSMWEEKAISDALLSPNDVCDFLGYAESQNYYTVTVTAKTWTPITYTVKFDSNGGSGTMSNQTFTYGTAQNLKNNAFTRTNYKFLGWSTSKTATTATYTNQQSVNNLTQTNNATVTLYAVWKSTIYSMQLSFAGNSNTGGTAPATMTCTSQSCVLPANTFTRTGYTFDGWEVCDDPVNVFGCGMYPAGEDLAGGVSEAHDGASYTVVAKWAPITYTVKFDANGGSGSTMSNMSFTYDSAKKLTKNTYTRADYKFLGWSTNKNALSATYTDEQSVKNLTSTSGATVTLYAIWKTTVFSVVPSINGNGNTGGTKPSTFSCTTKSCKLPANT